MDLLIKNARVYDVCSPLDGGRYTLWLRNGLLYAVDKSPGGVPTIEGEDIAVSPSWCDLRAMACDPGEEQKEDLHSLLRAAAAGGFSEVALLPDTQPVLQSKAQLKYLYEKAQPTGITIYPIAALSRDQRGEALCDFLDLMEAGVVLFGDGLRPLNNTQLLTQALRYLRPFGGVIMHRAEEASLAEQGCVHEGEVSTSLGLPGVPSYAEEVMLYGSLRALEYTKGRLHVSCLSSAGSVSLLRKAAKMGLSLSCDVSVQQLLFDDHVLENFSTNHKVRPPYRSSSDRRALCRAVAAGYIQAIVSDHRPQAPEDKMRPFAEAEEGVISLQTVLPVLLRLEDEIPLSASLRALYEGPRKVLGQDVPTVQIGQPVCYTVFDMAASWTLDTSTNYSKSSNSPFYGQQLKGKVVALLKGRKNLLQTTS